MVVRGAPAIGVAAAYGLSIAAFGYQGKSLKELVRITQDAAAILKASRPTAVNLVWAVDEALRRIRSENAADAESFKSATIRIAHELYDEDIQTNRAIGAAAAELFAEQTTVIHHCNTGSIATVDYGTALGAIRIASESGKSVFVYVDETRPRLQGAKLTRWELQQFNIPHQLIVDGASGHVMRSRKVDFCIVGCDRVAANGDVANKIGTYNLAVVAQKNNVPFYVAAPLSTIDLKTISGAEIEIEERPDAEVTSVDGHSIAPTGTAVYNPAFDVTPGDLISGFITERGIVRPPFTANLAKLMEKSR